MVWHYIRFAAQFPQSIKDGIVYQPDFSGFLHALDAKTGQVLWTHDLFAAVWGSPLLVDGKLYLGDEDGDVVIMQEGKTKKVIAEINMGSSVYSTPVPANGTMYISNRNQLYALAVPAHRAPLAPRWELTEANVRNAEFEVTGRLAATAHALSLYVFSLASRDCFALRAIAAGRPIPDPNLVWRSLSR